MARRHSRFVRPPVRTKMWIGGGVGATTVLGSSKTLISTLSAGALLLRPFTVLRTHLELHYRSDQQAASEFQSGAYGKIVVTDTAAAIGATAVPSPSGTAGDPEAAWFAMQEVMNFFQFISGVGFASGDGAGARFTIDSKAMRKVGPDDNIASVFTQDAAVGAIIFTAGRMLIQLH